MLSPLQDGDVRRLDAFSPAGTEIDPGSSQMVITEQIASCERRFHSCNFVSLWLLLAESALPNITVDSHGV